MKNLLRITFGLLLVSIVFMSCDKTTNNPSQKNSMKYNNKNYDLATGILFTNPSGKESKVKSTADINPVGLMLLSSGFILHETNGVLDTISGTGSGIMFEAYSGSPDKLDDGKYVFDSTSMGTPGTFGYGDAIFDENTENGDGTEVEINAGTLTVKTVGNEYEFTFDCTGDDGKSITGYYKGSVKSYVMRDVKSSKTKIQQVPAWIFRH